MYVLQTIFVLWIRKKNRSVLLSGGGEGSGGLWGANVILLFINVLEEVNKINSKRFCTT